MSPILDARQRVIAFGGRALADGQQPKYSNSPETVLFHKGHVLFNFASAREAARKAGTVIVAEGYMDVIALAKADFQHSVAPLGTALTAEQLKLLWTMAPTPSLCFDGDSAGLKAAYRALDGALPFLEPGRTLQFVFLPEGRDPDDMVRAGESSALAAHLAKPMPLIDVLWEREFSRHPIKTPEQRAALETRLMEFAALIEHKNLKFHYISAIRNRLRDTFRKQAFTKPVLSRASKRPSLDPVPAHERTNSLLASKIAQPSASCGLSREMLLLAGLLRHPWLLDEYAEDIASLHFDDPGCENLRKTLLAFHLSEEILDNEGVLAHLSRQGYKSDIARVQSVSALSAEAHFARNASKELVLESWRHVFSLHERAGSPRPVREAEREYLMDPSPENFQKLRAIVQQFEEAAT